ncbi:MAG: hypothetical protein MUO68_02990 [Desulfobacteraceae bacterium]|nr:hypothetical protein [Desulfobacteraceae bacterium]
MIGKLEISNWVLGISYGLRVTGCELRVVELVILVNRFSDFCPLPSDHCVLMLVTG